MKILDGNTLANEIKEGLKKETASYVASGKRPPHLTAIIVGDDAASKTYVASKAKDCAYIGFGSEVIHLPETVSERELLDRIEKVNQDNATDGLIVQLPLPSHISEKKVTHAIHPSKDVDGFTPSNFGLVCRGEGGFIPATPLGILKMLAYYRIPTQGKHCVVVGRSNIVGRPMSVLMSQPGIDATVTICHSKTADLNRHLLTADIVIAAVGKHGFIAGEQLKKGCVVIDVGINRVEMNDHPRGYVLKGDVDFDSLKGVCDAATPVPGGVGPMTRVGLMLNTISAYSSSLDVAK
jgi:methylenetetrahydrofolate dehydrogenase (NADP+)/methenyltetrahydrofolate cyclohydrolase